MAVLTMMRRGERAAISIVVPVYEERAIVPELMATLEPFEGLHEIVIVDGGSRDGTYESLVERGVGQVVRARRGRAAQMNEGARRARGHAVLFLHADTAIDHEGPELALRELDRGADGGCFKVRIKSPHRRLQIAGRLQTLRSRWLASATGDQSIFVRRDVFLELGGFDEAMSICEDIDFVRRFAQTRGPHKFACVDHYVTTSGRRWEKRGINRTIALMWGLRIAFHLGARSEALSRFYTPVR